MELRAGIIGAGFMGATHARRLQQTEGVKLVAACDMNESALNALKHSCGETVRGYVKWEDLLSAERLDVLYVCLPPHAHAGEVEAAAAEGIHLFLEKPIAINSQKARAMVAAIEKSKVKSQVGFHLRFRQSVRRLKSMIDDETAGRPCLFTGRYWTNMDGSDWWRDRTRSRGQIYEQVIHLYDLATFLFGKAEQAAGRISTLCHQGRRDYSIEDTSVGMLSFCSGALGVVTGSNCAVPERFFGDFRAVFENVTIDYTCTGQNWVEPDRARLYHVAGACEEIREDGDPYQLETQDFIDAIRDDRPSATPARDGLAAIELVEMILATGEGHA